jgi:hypothetical protein
MPDTRVALDAAGILALRNFYPGIPVAPPHRDGKKVVLIGGSGDNVAHMSVPLTVLAEDHELHVFDFKVSDDPKFPVTQTHLMNTEEGRASADDLLTSGDVGKVYLSVPPESHKDLIIKYLGYAARGLISGVVVTKPYVLNRKERVEVAIAHAAALKERSKLTEHAGSLSLGRPGEIGDDSLLWVHEHYQRKEAEQVLYRKLGEVTAVLGHLTDVTINIEETNGVDRPTAFGEGAFGDLGSHAISVALDISNSIDNDTGGRYAISGHSQSTFQRFRYEDAQVGPNTETGFIVHDKRTLTDHDLGDSVSDINYTMTGGKGLVDCKVISLTYKHPDTGEVSMISVDLSKNTLQVPDAVKDLFPKTVYTDNGYGRVMLAGLNGGDPNISFQHPKQAGLVVGLMEDLAKQGQQAELRVHPKGMRLQDLDSYAIAAIRYF